MIRSSPTAALQLMRSSTAIWVWLGLGIAPLLANSEHRTPDGAASCAVGHDFHWRHRPPAVDVLSCLSTDSVYRLHGAGNHRRAFLHLVAGVACKESCLGPTRQNVDALLNVFQKKPTLMPDKG